MLDLAEVVPAAVREGVRSPRFYRPELDCLRLLAFLLVFLRHAFAPGPNFWAVIASAGQGGVCLFFLLSAYLITELLEREAADTGRIDLRAFYVRRILRIWPLYLGALLIAWLLDIGSATPQMGAGRMASLLLLAGNWYVARHGLPASFALVLWSVSVEEQFYLVLPSARRFLGRKVLRGVGWGAVAISYGVIVWLCGRWASDLQLWVNSFVQMQFFGLGVLLALGLRGQSVSFPRPLRVALIGAGMVALAGSEVWFHRFGTRPLAWNAVREFGAMAIGSVLLFLGILGWGVLGRLRWLVYGGKISYGLYVWHVLGLNMAKRPAAWLGAHTGFPGWGLEAVRVALGLALTIGMAALSYRYFESCFLRLKEHFERVQTRPV